MGADGFVPVPAGGGQAVDRATAEDLRRRPAPADIDEVARGGGELARLGDESKAVGRAGRALEVEMILHRTIIAVGVAASERAKPVSPGILSRPGPLCRPEDLMADTQIYRVHARSDDHRHGHRVEATSVEDAAVAFVELPEPTFPSSAMSRQGARRQKPDVCSGSGTEMTALAGSGH